MNVVSKAAENEERETDGIGEVSEKSVNSFPLRVPRRLKARLRERSRSAIKSRVKSSLVHSPAHVLDGDSYRRY